jgi:hypothetical protein
MTARTPKEQEEEIIRAYLAGASAKEAAACFGYSHRTGLNILRRYGISSRTNSQVHRQYKINEDFFDTIDTEEKSYWLGFLTADGTISRGNRIRLALQARDLDHLHKFVAALESDQPVVINEVPLNGKIHSSALVQLNCKRLVSALEHLGVGERKSLTVTACEFVPEKLVRHYWRGLVDGDGCIKYDKRAKKWYIGLAGSYGIVSAFAKYITSFVETKASILPRGAIFIIDYGGAALPQKVASILYTDCNIFLDRKKLLADQLLAISPKRTFCTILR